MAIDLNNTEITAVGGGAQLSHHVSNWPAPIMKLVIKTYEPSPTYDPVMPVPGND